jgi:hypothetical protein
MSAGCRLSATRAAFHGVWRRFGDTNPEDQDGYRFRPTRTAFRRPSGVHLPCLAPTEVGGRPPLRFPAPSKTCHRSPASQRRAPDPKVRGRLVPPCCLSWAFVPYDTISDRRTRFLLAADPSAAACHVRGLGTSFAASTTDPPGARGAGASMGFALQGVPLVRERCPSRSPCPPDVTGRLSPSRGRKNRAAAFRALFSRRVRAVAGLPKETGRRCLLELHPSRVFSPSARAIACSRGAGPHVLGGDDVPTHLDPRASRIEWIGLVRFRTAYSLEVSHLSTVTSLRSSSRGAGSWFHLTQEGAPCGATPTAI